MRVLWCGDSPNVSTGFARCTAAACDALLAAGHEVHVLGINEFGDPHRNAPYDVWPCRNPVDGGHDAFGTTRLPILAKRLKPDLIVLLNDPWNVPGYMERLKLAKVDVPVVGWMAVDSRNQHGEGLNDLVRTIVWTDFAAHELRAGGYTGYISIVPLGVDLSVFFPRDRIDSRAALCKLIPEDRRPSIGSFIVGVVGRNQYRKRLDLTIAYFAKWVHEHAIDDAYLYLHVAPTGDMNVDIASLVHYYKLHGKVILAHPHIGRGDRTAALPYLYSAFDVLFSTSQGEGWGLPQLEAMACGVPCIVPNHSAFGEQGWTTKEAAYRVPCSGTALTAPTNGQLHTIGGVMDERLAVTALSMFYHSRATRLMFSSAGQALAQRYPWSSVGAAMVAELEAAHGLRAPVAEALVAEG